MTRPDAVNEITRCRNALVLTEAKRILVGGLSAQAAREVSAGWRNLTESDQYDDIAAALRGKVRPSKGSLSWGPDNLGVGVYQARLKKQDLLINLDISPRDYLVSAGTHLLIAFERGDPLSEVIASNLAFSCDATFMVFDELPKVDREAWIEAIYQLGNTPNPGRDFDDIVQRARAHLGTLDFSKFKTVLFVTGGFPWGIAVPEVATTHMYRYPDFGRATIEGIAASVNATHCARTALLIDPQNVGESEIPAIYDALVKNRTLTRVIRGPAAVQARVQLTIDLLPHDIIVLSSHASDAAGQRITYDFIDDDGRRRRLTVDRVMAVGCHPPDDRFLVTEHFRFHSLDGVDWEDDQGKDALPVGSAITTWGTMDDATRNASIVSQHSITRVAGSMAILLHDGIWLYAPQGFAPGSAPLIINNACWSWHELSIRTTFAGARGYLGSLFPILGPEAQALSQAIFGQYLGQPLVRAVWQAQRDIYSTNPRRPFVLVGLPFIAIRPNVRSAVPFLEKAYVDGISHWTTEVRRSPDVARSQDANRFANFLIRDLEAFRARGTKPLPRK